MQVRNSDRPANHIFCELAGRLLFVHCDNAHLTGLLESLFAGWQLTAVTSQDRQPHVQISCYVDQAPPPLPSELEQFEIAEHATCYMAYAGLAVDFGDSFLQLQSGDTVDVKIWCKSLPDSVNANLARTLSFAVCAGLRRHGIFELHSAGLQPPDNESGVVFIGPSGSGKSTLTAQLAASGWKYLSDDELLLTLELDTVVARGFRSFFALSSDAIALTGVVIGAGSSDTGKACFEPAEVFESTRATTAIPRHLFFTSISGRVETEVIELSRSETMTRLLRASPWATYDREIAAENLRVLSKLARQSTGFEFQAGRDLLTPGYADTFLQSVIKS